MIIKLAGQTLCLIGTLMTLAGVSETAVALECHQEGPYRDLICDQAHAVHALDNPFTNTGCISNPNRQNPEDPACIPTSQSQCEELDGYENAVNGMCISKPFGSYSSMCYDNFGITAVEIRFVVGRCEIYQGSCHCVSYYDTRYAAQYVQVCNCL